jgi:MFS family permease
VFVLLSSLDNAALSLLAPLYRVVGQDLGVPLGAVGGVTAAVILLTAISAVVWGYIGDSRASDGGRSRRRELMLGTGIWVAGTGSTALAGSYAALLVAQLAAAIGLGAVASIGFSLISDLVPPRRRGVVMSFWGLAQGAGTVAGTVLAGTVGAVQWRRPFLVLAAIGLVALVAYLGALDTPRGASEPELAGIFAAGERYSYHLHPGEVLAPIRRRTNVWLVVQGVSGQLVYGSLLWLPALLQARLAEQGYADDEAVAVGSLFAAVFQLGGVLSVLGGWLGDRLQRRNPSGRALVAAVGVLASVPFFLLLFVLPLQVVRPDGSGFGAEVRAVFVSLTTQPTVAMALGAALVALTLNSANAPNFFALLSDVNLPEHRATVFAAVNLANGVGRAAGNGLAGVLFGALAAAVAAPTNYVIGLAALQAFFVPTGWAWWRAARSAPADLSAVHSALAVRAERIAAHQAPT